MIFSVPVSPLSSLSKSSATTMRMLGRTRAILRTLRGAPGLAKELPRKARVTPFGGVERLDIGDAAGRLDEDEQSSQSTSGGGGRRRSAGSAPNRDALVETTLKRGCF